MTEDNRNLLRGKIKMLIKKAETDIIDMENNTQPVKPENSLGRISRMDAINNKSVMEAALRNKKRKLIKLRTALLNIENEQFGMCSNCGNEIQIKRILYMPESDKCVRCAART